MLRLRARIGVLAGAGAAALILSAGSVSAVWDPTDRGTSGVSVTVHQAGGPGAYSEAGGTGGVRCTYTRDDPKSPYYYGPMPNDPHEGEEGAYYTASCHWGAISYQNWMTIFNLWVPADRPAVAPAVLAQTARRYLPLPPPGIRTSPAAAVQVVNVPTWLWVDPATWGPRSATASVPNETATVTATPVSVTWTMGDGRRVVCSGPGTPYTGGDPAAPSPDCGHVYRRSSAGQAGLRYPVTATTSWRISWVASGVVAASGTLEPLARTATTSLRVAEAQTVN
jgi:hypothetical protein